MGKSDTISIIRKYFTQSLSSQPSEDIDLFNLDLMFLFFKATTELNITTTGNTKVSETECISLKDLKIFIVNFLYKNNYENYKDIQEFIADSIKILEPDEVLLQFDVILASNPKNKKDIIENKAVNAQILQDYFATIFEYLVEHFPDEFFSSLHLKDILPSILIHKVITRVFSFPKSAQQLGRAVKLIADLRISLSNNILPSSMFVLMKRFTEIEMFYHFMQKVNGEVSIKLNTNKMFVHEKGGSSNSINERRIINKNPLKTVIKVISTDGDHVPPEKFEEQQDRNKNQSKLGKVLIYPGSLSNSMSKRASEQETPLVEGKQNSVVNNKEKQQTKILFFFSLIMESIVNKLKISKENANKTRDQLILLNTMETLQIGREMLCAIGNFLKMKVIGGLNQNIEESYKKVFSGNSFVTKISELWTCKALRKRMITRMLSFFSKYFEISNNEIFYMNINTDSTLGPLVIRKMSQENARLLHLFLVTYERLILGNQSVPKMDRMFYMEENQMKQLYDCLKYHIPSDCLLQVCETLINNKNILSEHNNSKETVRILLKDSQFSNQIGEAELCAVFYSNTIKKHHDFFIRREIIINDLLNIYKSQSFNPEKYSNFEVGKSFYTIDPARLTELIINIDTDVLTNSLFLSKLTTTSSDGSFLGNVFFKMNNYPTDNMTSFDTRKRKQEAMKSQQKQAEKIPGYFSLKTLIECLDQMSYIDPPINREKLPEKNQNLLFPQESFCVIMMMAGTDYTKKLAGISHKHMFDCFQKYYKYIGDVVKFEVIGIKNECSLGDEGDEVEDIIPTICSEEYIFYVLIFYLEKKKSLDIEKKIKEILKKEKRFSAGYKISIGQLLENLSSKQNLEKKMPSLLTLEIQLKNIQWYCKYLIESSIGCSPPCGEEFGWRMIDKKIGWKSGNVIRITDQQDLSDIESDEHEESKPELKGKENQSLNNSKSLSSTSKNKKIRTMSRENIIDCFERENEKEQIVSMNSNNINTTHEKVLDIKSNNDNDIETEITCYQDPNDYVIYEN